MNAFSLLPFLTLVYFVSLAPSAGAAEPDDADKAAREQWTKYYAAQLPKYEFHLQSDSDTPLEVDPQARLRWANPVRVGHTHGDVFIWTYKGRAAMIGTIFSYDMPGEADPMQRRVAHEFHSLTTETILGTRDSARLPEIRGPGVEYEPIEGAPPPARTRTLRLTQMRRLAQEFEAAILDGDEMLPLRPLPQPIYRYDTEEGDDDGAVFAYVSGTDPELIMVLATRPTQGGPKWYFAAGRFASVALELKHKEKTVWSFESNESFETGYLGQHGIDFQPLVPVVEGEEE